MQLGRRLWSLLVVLVVVLRRVFRVVCECFYFILSSLCGVWADATTYCFKPLDQWLINSAPGGFFCFDNSHEDKTASSWFIYSEKNNPLISSWLFASLEYWLYFDRPPVVHNKKKSPDIYSFLSSQRLSWFDQDLCRRLAIFPYFWFHLLLDEKILTKEYLRNIYNSKKSINSSSFTRSHMMRQPIKEKDIEMIKGGGMLMFKLTHKFDRKNLDKDTYGYQFENNGKKIN